MEDCLAEGLDLSDHIPRLIVGDVLHNVFQQPLEDDICRMEVFNQFVNGEFLYLGVIESDAKISGEVQFSCKIAEHPLEKGVDGLHAEIIVVMEQIAESDTGMLADKAFRLPCLLADGFHVVSRIGQLLPNAIKLTENAHFHLFCGLIGKGHSQDVTVGLRILNHQLDIFCGERKCLSAPCACFIYCQRLTHISHFSFLSYLLPLTSYL